MKTKKKVILVLFSLCLIFITCLVGLVFYLQSHPSAGKSLIETLISRSTGTSVSIEALRYELKPLTIEARGIVLMPSNKGDGFNLEIPELRAKLALRGSFGSRSLILESLTINGLTLNISKKTSLPQMERQPTVLGWVLERFTNFFLFREVRFQGVEVAGGEIATRFEDQTLQLSGLRAVLNAEHLLEISCSARMELLEENLSLSIPDLQITTNQAISFTDPEIHCLLTAKQGVLQSPGPKVGSMEVWAEVAYFHSSQELTFSPLKLYLTGLTLGLESLRDPGPMELDLSTSGRFSLKEAQLSDCRFQLGVADVVELDGEISGRFTEERSVEVKLLDGKVIPQKLVDYLPAEMSKELSPMALSGSVGFRGRINGRREQERWKWGCELLSELEDTRLSYHTNQIQLSSDLAGEIGIKGTIPSLAVTATLKTDGTSVATNGIELEPFEASLSLSGTYPHLEIEDIVADIPLVKLTLGEKNIDIEGVQLSIKHGRLDGKRRSLSLPQVMLTTSLLKNLLLSLEAEGKHLTIVLEGRQVGLVKSAQALGLIPLGWQLDGGDRLHLKATVKDDGDLLLVSKLSLQELAFQNREGTSMGEGISIETEVDGQGRLGGPQITLNVSVKADKGEILHDRYYLDLNNNAFFSAGEIRYVAAHRSVELAGARVGLEDILALDLGGTISFRDRNPRGYLSIKAPRTSLQPIFQQFVLEPFKSESVLLTSLNLEGEISANLDLSGDGTDWKAKGHMVWLDGKLWQDEKTLSLEGINIDLPVWYQTRTGEAEEETIRGKVSIQSMNIPHLPEQSLHAQLEVQPNTLSVTSPTTLMVPGGEAQFGPLVANNLFSSNRTVRTSLEMKATDITSLLAGIWPEVPKGMVNARLEPILLERDMISSSGQVQLNVFDGEIILSDLGASGLLTSAPLFKLDVEVKDLSLAALTTGTSFGKIEGVLRGHIRNLVVANGQAQGFDLLLETVERKGTSQKISLKAVDNIAQIGGAQSPFMGTAGFFTSFFKLLPYKKIGVESSLRNDVFRINGTTKEGGKEYLVKRGGLSGVNIINQSQDNRISFKDMVKRIKRVTAQSKGPVVK